MPLNDAELLDRPGLRIVFRFPDGHIFNRTYTWRQVFGSQAPGWLFRSEPPFWLAKDPLPETRWHDPRLPIEYHGAVRAGYEDTARDWLENDRRRRTRG